MASCTGGNCIHESFHNSSEASSTCRTISDSGTIQVYAYPTICRPRTSRSVLNRATTTVSCSRKLQLFSRRCPTSSQRLVWHSGVHSHNCEDPRLFACMSHIARCEASEIYKLGSLELLLPIRRTYVQHGCVWLEQSSERVVALRSIHPDAPTASVGKCERVDVAAPT